MNEDNAKAMTNRRDGDAVGRTWYEQDDETVQTALAREHRPRHWHQLSRKTYLLTGGFSRVSLRKVVLVTRDNDYR